MDKGVQAGQKIILTGRRADICPDCQWKEICEKKEKELL